LDEKIFNRNGKTALKSGKNKGRNFCVETMRYCDANGEHHELAQAM